MKRPLIEACVDSYASAMAASRAGADRLELCAHLVIGGTTPTHALFRQVQRGSGVPINVLIRPRFGDFLYTEPELEEMCEEIAAFRGLGANGVVIGALTPDGELDLAQMRRMMACAGQMEVTLHRAFDMTRDPFRALEDAVSLGCRTILSSGQAANAALGAPLLAKLNRAGGRAHRPDGRLRREAHEHRRDRRPDRYYDLPHHGPQGQRGQRHALPQGGRVHGPAVPFGV